MAARTLGIRGNLESEYGDDFTIRVVAALEALAGLVSDDGQNSMPIRSGWW